MISVGESILNYQSLVVLTHFKGHTTGGYGGAIKNIGIGIPDGRIGKATVDHFSPHIVYMLRRMSVDCDCAGISAAEPENPDIGILASTDILAIDQASVDLVYAQGQDCASLRERIESRHGLRELGIGTDRYKLIEI